MPSNMIEVHIKLNDDKNPKIFSPSATSKNSVTHYPITFRVSNFCVSPELWIQFQGFTFVPSSDPVSNPLLFGQPESVGGQLEPASPDGIPAVTHIKTTTPNLNLAGETYWKYSILLLGNDGLIDDLDPIIVLSGDVPPHPK